MSQAPRPLAEVAAALRSGALDLHAYLDTLCDRIAADDPSILALLPEPPDPGRRARLHAAAETLLAQYPQPAARPPLFGVPVGVKDIIHVDGLPTRAGTAVPLEAFAGAEATVVARLRAAGALVLAKTVTTEFAYFEPGPTRNPHHRRHTPGGSSSGSAAAVAAGFAPLALGTQTVGSVIRPAAFCGVAGFKPSYSRIPTAGVLYYSRSVDHVGLFAPDAAGLALAASVLLEGWQSPGTPTSMPTVAVPTGPYLEQAEPEARAAFVHQVARLAAAGCEVLEVPCLEDIEAITHRHRWLSSAEFAEEHAQRFDAYGALYRPRTALLVETGRAVTAEQRTAGLEGRLELRERFHSLMDRDGIDLWVSPPATGPAPEGIQSTGNPAMNLPWTHSGLPAVTLPAGLASNGLPLGLQLAARFGEDERLLAWSEALAPSSSGAAGGIATA